jgi:putative chitinase
MAAIGTIGIETAHTWEPVLEAFWMSEAWRRANLRYWPFVGRGFVQLTWLANYQRFSRFVSAILGRPIDLAATPALAMVPEIAAAVLAAYFVHHPSDDANLIPSAARRGDWTEVRRLVQGADAGLPELVATVQALQAA